jgi:hypothetical protein
MAKAKEKNENKNPAMRDFLKSTKDAMGVLAAEGTITLTKNGKDRYRMSLIMNKEEIAQKMKTEGVIMNGMDYDEQDAGRSVSPLTKWLVKANDDGYTLASYGCEWQDGAYAYNMSVWRIGADSAEMLESSESLLLRVTGEPEDVRAYEDGWEPSAEPDSEKEDQTLWDKRMKILSGSVEDARIFRAAVQRDQRVGDRILQRGLR